jgi:soluble cytochrome b562
MAKSKKEAVNKSQAIRDALDAHPDKSPSEIADDLKAKGLDVNAQYVSTIKSNAKAKSRRSKLVRRGKASSRSNGLGPVGAALAFIREAGGLEAAKHALQTVEEIRSTIR